MKLSVLIAMNAILVPIAVYPGCKNSPPPGYGTSLEQCNQNAKTCRESIDCENHYRAEKGRPLRDVDAGCN